MTATTNRRHIFVDTLIKLIYVLFVFVAAIPLYVNTSTAKFNLPALITSVNPAVFFESGLNIHFGIVTTAIAAVIALISLLVKRSLRLHPEVPFVVGLFFCFSFSVLVGQFFEPGVLNIVFYIQTLIPILAFFIGAYYPVSRRLVLYSLKLIVVCNTLVLLLVYTFLLGAVSRGLFQGLSAFVRELAIVIPQFNDYYPFAFVISLSLNIAWLIGARTGRSKVLWILCLLVHAAYPPISWSRTGLILAALVVMVHLTIYLWARVRSPMQMMRKASTVVMASVGIIAMTSIVMTASTIRERISSESVIAGSDSRRIELAKEASVLILESPLVGRMFIPDWGQAADGSKREVRRLFGAHNQYLDYGLRGGVFALIFMLITFVVSGWRNFRRMQSISLSHEVVIARNAWMASVFAILLGNNTQLYLVQAFTGTLIWFLTGTMARLNGKSSPL